MDFVQYKCPCCGAALKFSEKEQKLSCESCGNTYELETVKRLNQANEQEEEQDLSWGLQKEDKAARQTEDGRYICPSCGAEVEADENTMSTKCPYCDNVVVIRAAASGEFQPDAVIPFQIESSKARNMLETFCKGKRLLPKDFKNKSYLKNLKGHYVPYWLFDCEAEAHITFHATRTRCFSDSDYYYEEVSHFLVTRGGGMSFSHVPVDGSTAMEDETTESIEPFDYAGLKEFQPAYLAGYETDQYDVSAKEAESRAKERLYNSAEDTLRSTVLGYDTVMVKQRQMKMKGGKVHYALLPVWLFETVYKGEKYQFAINGQTGKMVGELPVDKGAFWKYLCGFTALGTVLLSLIGMLVWGGVLS